MAKVIVLGAGLGGVACAYEMKKKLGAGHQVTLVGSSPYFEFTPSNPWVAVGWRKPEQTRVELAGPLAAKNVGWIPKFVQKIDAEGSKLVFEDGTVEAYDYLAITTGPKLAFDEVPGLGPKGHTVSVCTQAHSLDAWDKYQAFLQKRRSFQPPKPIVGFVRIEGCKEVNPELVKAKLRIEPGDELNIEAFKAAVTRVYTMGDFEVVDFRIKEEQGKLGAVVTVKEKPWGPDYLRFGLNLNTDFSAGSSYNILVEHRKSNMNRLGAEWRNLLEIGATRGLTSTWYQPLDLADRFFVEPSLTWKDTRRDVYKEGDLVGVYSTSYWNVGIKAGMNFGTASQLRAELAMGQGDAKPDSQNEGVEMPVYNNTDRDTLAAVYEIDTFDNHNIPHQGTRLKAIWQSSLEALGADYAYDKASLSYTKASTFAGRHTLLFGLSGGVTLDEDAPYFDQFQLGGLFKLTGLSDGQLVGQNMASGELLYYTNLSKSLHVGVGLETGTTWDDRSEAEFDDLRWGGVVFAGLETIIGPVYIAYGFTEGEDSGRLRFSLGKTF